MFGKPSVRRAIAVGAVVLALATACSRGYAAHTDISDSAQATQAPDAPALAPEAAPTPTLPPDAAAAPDFATVSKLMNDAIAAHRLLGAVVVIGHGGKVVFQQAYGSRKLAGEPGLDGSPSPAEPMTEDTIFDMASLTKPLATATAVMQLHEQGKVQFDDPVQQYLPDFNPANDPQRAKVTVRMLLTHTSGETGDVDLKDPWGLDGADKTEGIHRALSTPLESGPGERFRYSDINFILLGALIENVTGEAEDVYVQQHVFAPLGMEETRYLPLAKACGPHTMRGAAIAWAPAPKSASWSRVLQIRGAPVCCRASHRQHVTTKTGTMRARIQTLITCYGARCMTRRRGAWGEWPGMPACSRRHTMSASMRKPCLIGLQAVRAVSADASDSGVDDDSPAARTHSSTTPSRERCRSRSRRKHTEYNESAAGSALPGDQGTKPTRLWLGYRYAPFHAARHGLSHR